MGYDVTGVDISGGGIQMANKKREKMPIEIQERTRFLQKDSLTVEEGFDVVFCRAPNYASRPSSDIGFQQDMEKSILLSKTFFFFSIWTGQPYNQYNGNTFCHDPESLRDIFSRFGECSLRLVESYIVVEIKRNNIVPQ